MWRRLAVLILISTLFSTISYAQDPPTSPSTPPQIAVVDAYLLREDVIDIGWLGWITLLNQSDQAVTLIAVDGEDSTAMELAAHEPTAVFVALSIPDDVTDGDALPLTLTFADTDERTFDVLIAVPVLDQPPSEARIAVANAWARPMAAGGVSGIYMQMFNLDDDDVTIISVTSPISPLAELHETTVENNLMRMNPVSSLVVPAHGTAVLEPGANHLMLSDLSVELIDGAALTLTLQFDDGSEQTIGVPIYDRLLRGSSTGSAHQH